MDVLVGGPMTGAAMNPGARVRAGVAVSPLDRRLVWYVGPFVGGALAALAYERLYLRSRRPVEPVGPPETGVIEPRPGDTALS